MLRSACRPFHVCHVPRITAAYISKSALEAAGSRRRKTLCDICLWRLTFRTSMHSAKSTHASRFFAASAWSVYTWQTSHGRLARTAEALAALPSKCNVVESNQRMSARFGKNVRRIQGLFALTCIGTLAMLATLWICISTFRRWQSKRFNILKYPRYGSFIMWFPRLFNRRFSRSRFANDAAQMYLAVERATAIGDTEEIEEKCSNAYARVLCLHFNRFKSLTNFKRVWSERFANDSCRLVLPLTGKAHTSQQKYWPCAALSTRRRKSILGKF